MAKLMDRYNEARGPGRYLSAANMPEGWSQVYQIDAVDFEDIETDEGTKRKLAVKLAGEDQLWVLNQGAVQFLCDNFGENDSDAVGQWVELFRTKTHYKGQIVPCIRARLPRKHADAPEANQNDDIPF